MANTRFSPRNWLLPASGKLKQNGEEINEMNKIHLDFAASMSKMSLVLAESNITREHQEQAPSTGQAETMV